MANPFDQFDEIAPSQPEQQTTPNSTNSSASTSGGGNPFDQFDAEPVNTSVAKVKTQQADPGFAARVSADLAKRNDMVQNAVDQFGVGPSALAAGVGKGVFGSANDIIGEGVKSAYTSLPDTIRQPISNTASKAANYVMNTDTGKAVAEAAKDIGSAYSDFAQQNPKTANALESGADTAMGITNLVPLAKGVSAAEELVPSAVKDFVADEGTTAGLKQTASLAKDAKLTPSQIRQVAGRTFEAADQVGGALPAAEHEKFINAIQSAAQQSPETTAYFGESPLKSLADNAETQRGNPLSFKGASEIDKELTARIRAETDTDGFMSPLGQKYTTIQDTLRDSMESPTAGQGFELQNQAKALWAQQARMNDIQSMIAKARNMQNPASGLQTQFRQLLSNGRRMRGFDEGDQALIQRIASNPGMAGELMRAGGSRLLNIFSFTHGPAASIATNIGTSAARNIGESMAYRPAEQLMDRLSTRNPLPDLTNYPPQAKGGRVMPKPKSYPALKERRV